MHKYRAAARQSAWWSDENERNLNPFQKLHGPRRRKADEENGLRAVKTNQSESAVTPSIELTRRGQNQDYSGPQHANTMPTSTGAGGSGGGDGPSNVTDVAIEEEPEKSQDSGTGTSQTAVEEEDPKSLRRRLKIPMLHQEKSNGNIEHTNSSGSQKPKKKFTPFSQFKATILNSWINILLIAVPVGIAVNYVHNVDPAAVFVINFIGIIPLAAMLSYATEEIALRTGETIGGLLNATFGNAVELIVSILALVAKPPQIVIVQTSLIGSMLSNLLLVMGMCFFFGGWNRIEQNFNVVVAQTAASLLALAVGSLIIPAAFQAWAAGEANAEVKTQHIAALSRGTAVLLLLVYACYLFFQLKTHTEIYNAPSQKVDKRRTKVEGGEVSKSLGTMGAGASTMGGPVAQANITRTPEEEDDKEEPQLSIWVAMFTLAASTALVAICADYMVDSINALTKKGGLSKTFVGLILLPIVGNAAEHATAVTVACKDKMDLAIGVAVGSSMQIALLVIPFIVVLGWILGNDNMNLDFDGFQIAVLFVAVLLVNYLIADGKSHWLEGVLLMTLYLIIAIAAWFYPAIPGS